MLLQQKNNKTNVENNNKSLVYHYYNKIFNLKLSKSFIKKSFIKKKQKKKNVKSGYPLFINHTRVLIIYKNK